MEQKQKANEVAEKQIRAYRKRLQEMLATTETDGGTSLVRELQDLALEVGAEAPRLQQGDFPEADIHGLLVDIYEALRAQSTRGIRRPAARSRFASFVAVVFGTIARLRGEAA